MAVGRAARVHARYCITTSQLLESGSSLIFNTSIAMRRFTMSETYVILFCKMNMYSSSNWLLLFSIHLYNNLHINTNGTYSNNTTLSNTSFGHVELGNTLYIYAVNTKWLHRLYNFVCMSSTYIQTVSLIFFLSLYCCIFKINEYTKHFVCSKDFYSK